VIGLFNLLVPFSVQAVSVAPLSGKHYATEQFGDFARNPWPIHIHVAIGVLFVVVAAFQFWRKFRNRNLRLRRSMGYVAFACLVLLPVTGVACSIIYPFGGVLGVVPNVFWMVVILTCVGLAWRAVRGRDIRGHEAWVTRAAAMTVGITLSRLYQPILVHVFDMEQHLSVALVFWLGQGEGLIAAELWLRRDGGPLARKATFAGMVLRKGTFEALDRIKIAPLFVAEAPVVRSAQAIVLFHRPEDEPPLSTGRRFYRLWLEFTQAGLFSGAHGRSGRRPADPSHDHGRIQSAKKPSPDYGIPRWRFAAHGAISQTASRCIIFNCLNSARYLSGTFEPLWNEIVLIEV
jgi:Predicted membrane protein (DUF2306)